jgi:hypothetical protein
VGLEPDRFNLLLDVYREARPDVNQFYLSIFVSLESLKEQAQELVPGASVGLEGILILHLCKGTLVYCTSFIGG